MKSHTPILVATVFSGIVTACCCLNILSIASAVDKNMAEACPSIPENFTEDDLVGSWVGKYFENTEKLIVRKDGTYKQIFSNDFLSFESDWEKWHIEYDANGYALLHMVGMRRCDGHESECNDPGGGLPSQTLVINPCENTSMTYPDDEIILFVTGSLSDVPRSIMLQQAAFAGSDWDYTFRLEEPVLP